MEPSYDFVLKIHNYLMLQSPLRASFVGRGYAAISFSVFPRYFFLFILTLSFLFSFILFYYASSFLFWHVLIECGNWIPANLFSPCFTLVRFQFNFHIGSFVSTFRVAVFIRVLCPTKSYHPQHQTSLNSPIIHPYNTCTQSTPH